MQLQPRDLIILQTVGELGTADTRILQQLHFPNDNTGRACQQRLRKIVEAGLLRNVRITAVDGGVTAGSHPQLFFLTPEGGQLVADETGLMPRRISRSEPKQFTLRHRFEVVRARLAIDQAAQLADLPSPEWIMEEDSKPGVTRRKGRLPTDYQILRNDYTRNGRRVRFRPDAACHIRLPAGDAVHSLLAYLELDRSTEGHKQWKDKLRGIEPFFDDPKGPAGHWPDLCEHPSDSLRKRPPIILVLCKSKTRMLNLIETTRASPKAHLIRFSTYPLDPAEALTGHIWHTCDGKTKSIVGRSF